MTVAHTCAGSKRELPAPQADEQDNTARRLYEFMAGFQPAAEATYTGGIHNGARQRLRLG